MGGKSFHTTGSIVVSKTAEHDFEVQGQLNYQESIDGHEQLGMDVHTLIVLQAKVSGFKSGDKLELTGIKSPKKDVTKDMDGDDYINLILSGDEQGTYTLTWTPKSGEGYSINIHNKATVVGAPD